MRVARIQIEEEMEMKIKRGEGNKTGGGKDREDMRSKVMQDEHWEDEVHACHCRQAIDDERRDCLKQ